MSRGIIAARASRWLALGLVTLLSACLGRSPDPRYFVLGESGPVVEGEGERTISIQLASATLPDYLVRPEMVWREGGAEISIHAQQRWAGGLEANVLRALGSRLAGQPGMSWSSCTRSSPGRRWTSVSTWSSMSCWRRRAGRCGCAPAGSFR